MFKAKNGSNILNLRFYGYKCLIQAHKAHSNMLKLALAYGHDQVFTFFSHYFFYKKKQKKKQTTNHNRIVHPKRFNAENFFKRINFTKRSIIFSFNKKCILSACL